MTSIFTNEQLRYVASTVVKRSFPEYLMASGQIVEFETGVPKHKKLYTYHILDARGVAAFLACCNNDIPLINLKMEERTTPGHVAANGYKICQDDIDTAEAEGVNISTEFAIASRQVVESMIDETLWFGFSQLGIPGFINNPNVPVVTALNNGNSNGFTSETIWDAKTADQIYLELNDLATAPIINTNGVERANKIAIAEDAYEIIAALPYPANAASGKTLLQFFLEKEAAKKGGGIQEIIPVARLNTAGVSGKGLAIAYNDSLDKVKAVATPTWLTTPELRSDNWLTYVKVKIFGVVFLKPLSASILTGI